MIDRNEKLERVAAMARDGFTYASTHFERRVLDCLAGLAEALMEEDATDNGWCADRPDLGAPMTAELPQDIREKVDRIYTDCRFGAKGISAEDIIALALLAHEREVIERCAKIAEEYANTYCERISDGLAAAIRETAR